MQTNNTTEQAPVQEGDYALASNVVGFKNRSSIRVKILRVAGPFDVIVKTASLIDAGSVFALHPNQLCKCD